MTENTKSNNAAKALIELFQRRYLLRILWELRDSALTFRALQQACGATSPSTLSARLIELRKTDLIEHSTGEGYALTLKGQSLLAAAATLFDWASHWKTLAPKTRRNVSQKNKSPSAKQFVAKKLARKSVPAKKSL